MNKGVIANAVCTSTTTTSSAQIPRISPCESPNASAANDDAPGLPLPRALLLAYPWVTLFAIVVTANHYWLDAAGGAFALTAGFVLAGGLTRLENRLRFARLVRHAPPTLDADPAEHRRVEVVERDSGKSTTATSPLA